MLTEAQIRDVIKSRLEAIQGSCNSAHIHHNDGVFRGLIWALTGEDPGHYLTKDCARLLDLAGVPYVRDSDGLRFRDPLSLTHASV